MKLEEAFGILRSLPDQWGASESDVREVECRLGARLPVPLRELMLCTGRAEHMRWLFPEGEIAPLAELPNLKEIATEILECDAPHLRPAFPFVVLSQHDGYFFTFVQADGLNADPEVMGYLERHGYGPGCLSIGQSIAAAVRRALSRA